MNFSSAAPCARKSGSHEMPCTGETTAVKKTYHIVNREEKTAAAAVEEFASTAERNSTILAVFFYSRAGRDRPGVQRIRWHSNPTACESALGKSPSRDRKSVV